jgi:tRNA 2-thiouridine synthesizing protein C
MGKKILFINRHAPYGSSISREALDAVLAAAVYEQELSLLFMDDGVFQLLKHQEAGMIAQKSLSASLPVLPLYGVERIYVHCESLDMRALTPTDLVLNEIQLLNSQQITQLLNEQDQILSF